MSKSQRIEKRINRIENRFRNKVASGRKGTDMDIELHERRVKELKNKISPLGFRMPHSPLNQNDSIAASKAFKLDTENYMKRKFRGNNPKLGPITPEENLAEAKSEQSEKYYNIEEKRLKLIPTDDGEVQDESFKSKLKKWQLSPLNQNGEVYNMTPNATKAESKAVRDKFDATYMKGRGKVNETEPHADSEWENATYQLMNEGTISESNDQAYPLIQARVERNRGNR